MDIHKRLNLVKSELMIHAMCSNISELKNVYYQNNNNFGNKREWLLLADIFMYSCETMNIKLLDALYEMYETIDISIRKDNNHKIFHRSILYKNTSFYTQLLSHEGPLFVFNNNTQNLIDFTIKNRCRFMPILQSLKPTQINHYIQIIIEDAIISYDENIMIINDEEYINGDYVYMVFEYDGNPENSFEKKIERIPLSVKDDQYIKFLETLQ